MSGTKKLTSNQIFGKSIGVSMQQCIKATKKKIYMNFFFQLRIVNPSCVNKQKQSYFGFCSMLQSITMNDRKKTHKMKPKINSNKSILLHTSICKQKKHKCTPLIVSPKENAQMKRRTEINVEGLEHFNKLTQHQITTATKPHKLAHKQIRCVFFLTSFRI